MQTERESLLVRFTTIEPVAQSDSSETRIPVKEEGDEHEERSSNTRSYRVLVKDGESYRSLNLPFLSAQSIVHMIREIGAAEVFRKIGMTKDDFKDDLTLSDAYYMATSAGTTQTNGSKMPWKKDEARNQVANLLPVVSALGFCSWGEMFASKVRVSQITPFIEENPRWVRYLGGDGPQPVAGIRISQTINNGGEYIDSKGNKVSLPAPMTFFRKEDPDLAKVANAKQNHRRSMPNSFGYITAGTPMAFTVEFEPDTTPLEKSAIGFCLQQIINERFVHIGAHIARGCGLVEFESVADIPSGDLFTQFLDDEENQGRIREFLTHFAPAEKRGKGGTGNSDNGNAPKGTSEGGEGEAE